jgi:hypothetical protein
MKYRRTRFKTISRPSCPAVLARPERAGRASIICCVCPWMRRSSVQADAARFRCGLLELWTCPAVASRFCTWPPQARRTKRFVSRGSAEENRLGSTNTQAAWRALKGKSHEQGRKGAGRSRIPRDGTYHIRPREAGLTGLRGVGKGK